MFERGCDEEGEKVMLGERKDGMGRGRVMKEKEMVCGEEEMKT